MYTVSFTSSLFTTSLSFLKSTRAVFNLSKSILSTSSFNLAKFDFNARLDVSIHVAFLKSVFKSTLTFMSSPKSSYGLGKY